MTYEQVIAAVHTELRDSGAWPSPETKLPEQLNLLWQAALAVGKQIPLTRLTLKDSEPLDGADVTQVGITKRYEMPADVFSFREDYGLRCLLAGGREYFFDQAVPYESVVRAETNSIQRASTLFSLDLAGRRFYANNIQELQLRYAAMFARPAKEDNQESNDPNFYKRLEYPLGGNDAERAIHIVASHVNGVTIRDPAQATFQGFLTQVYGE